MYAVYVTNKVKEALCLGETELRRPKWIVEN